MQCRAMRNKPTRKELGAPNEDHERNAPESRANPWYASNPPRLSSGASPTYVGLLLTATAPRDRSWRCNPAGALDMSISTKERNYYKITPCGILAWLKSHDNITSKGDKGKKIGWEKVEKSRSTFAIEESSTLPDGCMKKHVQVPSLVP